MAFSTETPSRPVTVHRTRNLTEAVHGDRAYRVTRVSYGRWRTASGPAVDGGPDLSADWAEHGFHYTRHAAEQAAVDAIAGGAA